METEWYALALLHESPPEKWGAPHPERSHGEDTTHHQDQPMEGVQNWQLK